MLNTQIEKLRIYLSGQVPIQTFIYNDESEDGFRGITDQYDTYAYIRRNKGKLKLIDKSNIYGCQTYEVEGSYRLIVDAHKKIENVEEIIKLRLIHSPASCGKIRVTGYDDNSRDIYKQETGKEWKDGEHKLLCFEFTITDITDCSCTDIPCLQ